MFSGTNQKPERRRPFGTGLVRHCPQGLFSPFFTFLRAVIFRPFRLSLAPTICPWVSEDIIGAFRSVYCHSQGGGSYFPYILLNEIQTMFSQLAKRSARVLPADLVLIMRITSKSIDNGLEKKQKHGGRRRDCFSLLYFGNSQIY